MKILDGNTVDQKKIETDVCIIGAGPAGITLAAKLEDSGLDVIIAESGGLKKKERANHLNSLDIKSNFTYRDGKIQRIRQLGGTANLWAGRVVPFSFDDRLDMEWDGLKERVVPFFEEAFRIFGIDSKIQNEHKQSDDEFYAYWGDQTERFNYKSGLLERNHHASIFYNLTCIGDPKFEGEKIEKMVFQNGKQERIEVQSKCFVFAMGAVSNTRLLLIIKEMLPLYQREKMRSTGKFVMDHPRIWHGDVVKLSERSGVSRYQIKRTKRGLYKTGIRNNQKSVRVYCNLMRRRSSLNRLIELIPSESFEYSFRKLLMREKGVLKAAVNEFLKWTLIQKSATMKGSLKNFFNRDTQQDFQIMTYCEQRPRAENHYSLTNEKDQNGQPMAKLINNLHASELQEVSDFYSFLDEYFKELNCQLNYDSQYLSDPINYTDAAHPMGGTRYSSHADRKVVEGDLSVVGIPNIYIVGSSVFPTGSVENPTHLIVSLSCYLAEVLSKKFG